MNKTSEALETSEVWTQIIAYCLMPNHFHMIAHLIIDED
jgi:REP element-mobilizing transposase RayT